MVKNDPRNKPPDEVLRKIKQEHEQIRSELLQIKREQEEMLRVYRKKLDEVKKRELKAQI